MRGVVPIDVSATIWALWKTRNAACFDKVYPYDPTCVNAKTVQWLNFWVPLQLRGRRDLQRRGAKALLRVLLRVAAEIFSKRSESAPMVMRIEE